MTKKMKTKKKNKKILALIVCLLALLPSSMYAQFSFDVTSVEAYINDHKEQRSLLPWSVARGALLRRMSMMECLECMIFSNDTRSA